MKFMMLICNNERVLKRIRRFIRVNYTFRISLAKIYITSFTLNFKYGIIILVCDI